MEKRIENFVKAIAYKDVDGKVFFPFDVRERFNANGNDHLLDVPVKGYISLECEVTDDTIEIDYKLLGVTRDDKGMLKIDYVFNGNID